MAIQVRLIKGWVALVIGLIAMAIPIHRVEATHLRAGQITVTRDNCTSRTVVIKVEVYTDTESSVLFGGSQDILYFGDGNHMLVPETPNTPYPGGGTVGVASFSIPYTYGGPGKYTISYLEPNRNPDVLNMFNSVNTTFYLETQIDLSLLGCGNSPALLVPPIDRACTGVAFYHNPGAYDPDGDSLSYELDKPLRAKADTVSGYRAPNDPSFYTDFLTGNEDGNGPPTFSIDPISGTLIWDAPSLPPSKNQGEFNIAFIVKEWRNTNGVWVQIGFVRRDMQIIVERCTNDRPELQIPEDTCVIAGDPVIKKIVGTDPDGHDVKIEVFSEILASSFPSRATFSPIPGNRPQPDTITFTWNTTCEHVKDQPYQVVFKVTDNPPLGPRLVTFETWRITVVAPPPLWEPTPSVVDVAKRHVLLDWQTYACVDEASKMQVWRKVGDTNFTPSECQTGLPESLGFTLIAQIPISQTSFNDTNGGKGLDVGAQYCYRLVAVFSPPRGGESIVSDEICIPPILSSDPVITNVSVERTSETDGEIKIAWTPPLDTANFPGPYDYKVQRVDGSDFIDVSPVIDTTFFTDEGLNTKDKQFFYRIMAFPETSMDTIGISSISSSVSLDLQSRLGEITLKWSALVPWSNQLQDFPLHDVYRGPAGSTEADLQLIGTYTQVDVLQEGFAFLDTGLDENTEYCYRVMTRGGYGNPAIPEPLENYSQIICAFPTIDEPPCAPVITTTTNSCDESQSCSQVLPKNEFSWTTTCEEDIKDYIIYAAVSENSEYFPEDTVYALTYVSPPLISRAFCYKVKARNRSGILSDFSESICFDNCPYYELPNVFTPGDGNDCNDLFSAFGWNLGEDPGCPPVDPLNERCAKFVLRVDFSVYNRWGKKVYDYTGQEGDENNSIYINWDGRDSDGKDLTTGVYYYLANITFRLADPEKRYQQRKGWIHIIRPGNVSTEN